MGDTVFRVSREKRDPDGWKSAGGRPDGREGLRASPLLFSAPSQLHFEPPPGTMAAPAFGVPGYWEGAAIWAGSGRPFGSDCMRNLRNGTPSHRATENRPAARERRARSRCRPAPEFDRKGAGPSGAGVRAAPIGSHEAPAL